MVKSLEPTSHSLCPWKPSGLSFLTATTIPIPGFEGARVCSSIQPLKTCPNPPSPRRLSGRKFLVAFFRSLNKKAFKFEDDRISHSVRGVESSLLSLIDGRVNVERLELVLLVQVADDKLVLLVTFDGSEFPARNKRKCV